MNINSKFGWNVRLAILCIVLGLICSACAGTMGGAAQQDNAPPPVEETVAEDDDDSDSSLLTTVLFYPVNRVMDILDILRLNVAFGPGFGLNLRATKFVQVGIENYMGVRVGLGKNGGLFFPRYGLLYTESEMLTMGLGLAYTGGGQRGFTEWGGTFHLGLIGAEAAIDVSELLDALGGFILIDFKGDDF